MKIRMNMDSCKNALGTVFLLATAFFVCSTFISMRSVFADPILPEPQQNVTRNNRQFQRTRQITPKRTIARSVGKRVLSGHSAVSNTSTTNVTNASSRSVGTRTVSARPGASNRTPNAVVRNIAARPQNMNAGRSNTNTRAVRARSTISTTPSRVSVSGSAMTAGIRSGSTSYTYLNSKLYSGTYSNLIDSSTGLISADAYSNCLESYYTCMDEICTARSDTKGRCSCAGRATNFLEAEKKLEEANEELIKLSGQLSLLISTKGKGEDLAYAFSLTDAEKVMNCVSYQDAKTVAGTTRDSNGSLVDKGEYMRNWCRSHMMYEDCGYDQAPSYCSKSGNNFGFDISTIDGSSSDILAQLKAWADARDLAKQYTSDNTENLLNVYDTVAAAVNTLAGITSNVDSESASLDKLANKWGYKLFEYAHNNVCGRVLDSCFNGIYESCGNPGTVTDSDGNKHTRCANGATSNCPFNYNSYISVDAGGDVELHERGDVYSSSDSYISSCFGYTTSSNTTTDPYVSIRGPVADARRSIMQKYLLDANSACDVYGAALKQTAQNINYQKIAAEQALQQKRLEFKQEETSKRLSDATAAIENFNECISEIWDCYEQYDKDEKWTTARIKSYCSQKSQVPHCYDTMICSPLQTQMIAVIDVPDKSSCNNSDDYLQNTCRNVVTISEILYGTGEEANATSESSAAIREACLQKTLVGDGEECNASNNECLRGWKKTTTATTESTGD